MKTKNILMMAAVMVVGFASCSSEDELAQSNYPADNVVRINSNVNDMKTRASYTTETLDAFSFYIKNEANENYNYFNKKVENKSGVWNPESMMLWQGAKQSVSIIAVAPYNKYANGDVSRARDYTVSVETTQTESSCKSDFLVYKNMNFVPEEDLNSNGAVDVTFTHVFSLLNIHIEIGNQFNGSDGLASNIIKNVKIGGTITSCDVDFTTTPVSVIVDYTKSPTLVAPEEGDFEKATTEQVRAAANYSAILIPQTINEGFRIEFDIESESNGQTATTTYVWTSPESVTLESGKSHLLKLTVGKDLMLIGNMETTPWTEGTGGDLETE
ncbi:MAG TPA: hypothetical protein DDW28_10460 [Prevotella sp.]|nr:fimbrillin family protein [uncultured Prevotella sp.]HBF06469.1 hypothetical protein [Candidatus Segatella violae]